MRLVVPGVGQGEVDGAGGGPEGGAGGGPEGGAGKRVGEEVKQEGLGGPARYHSEFPGTVRLSAVQ